MATPRMFEWTLEHHKRFLDTFILLDSDNKIVGLHPLLRAELLTLVGCRCSSIFVAWHFVFLRKLQRKSESLFCSKKVSFKGLYVAPKKLSSSWTLELHRRVVEAVIQLGGLSNSKATPKAVLKLMAEEDRRRGLTARMISHHLSELLRLQKVTQRLIAEGMEGGEEAIERSIKELEFLVFKGVPQQLNNNKYTHVDDPLLRQHLGLLEQRNISHRISFHIIKSDRELLKAFG